MVLRLRRSELLRSAGTTERDRNVIVVIIVDDFLSAHHGPPIEAGRWRRHIRQQLGRDVDPRAFQRQGRLATQSLPPSGRPERSPHRERGDRITTAIRAPASA
jgi:hypothetical protein